MQNDANGRVKLFESEDKLNICRETLEVGESSAQALNAARLAAKEFGPKSLEKTEMVSLSIPGGPKYKEISILEVFKAYPPSVE